MGLMLTRDMILQSVDIVTEELSVPEWGGSVMIKGMTAAERDEFESVMMQRTRGRKGAMEYELNTREARARIAALCIVDDKGERLFSLNDVKALGQKSAAALDRVYDVATRLSGIGERDVEELVKN
jgi:hypothetical protein